MGKFIARNFWALVVIAVINLFASVVLYDYFFYQRGQHLLLTQLNKEANTTYRHTGIRAYNRFPAGYDLDREYVIRYPLQSTPSQRLKTIGEVFPTILTEQYECERFYVVHPDESGLPVVSKGEGRFPGKPLGKWEMDELIKLCGYTPGKRIARITDTNTSPTYSLQELKDAAWNGRSPEITVFYYRDGLYAVGYPYENENHAPSDIKAAIPILEQAEDYRGYFIVQHYPGQPPRVLPGRGKLPYLSASQKQQVIDCCTVLRKAPSWKFKMYQRKKKAGG